MFILERLTIDGDKNYCKNGADEIVKTTGVVVSRSKQFFVGDSTKTVSKFNKRAESI